MVLIRALILLWCIVSWIREPHRPLPIESMPVDAEAVAPPPTEMLPA